ncbi:hypothetical protein SUGI_1102530 [Cryptomeria japonica]|nr:hypothetical protein SUGI_1102530 [Cryptomeria japonica]
MAHCRKDKSSANCVICFKVVENQVHNFSGVSTKAYYDGCYLRYETFNFYDQYTDVIQNPFCGNVKAADSSLISATGSRLLSDLCTPTPRLKDYFAAQTRQGPSNTRIHGLTFCLLEK